MVKSPILDNIFEEIYFGVTFFFFESDHGEFWPQLIILIESLYFFRRNFSSNNLKEAEAKKAAALLAVEDIASCSRERKYCCRSKISIYMVRCSYGLFL